MVLANVLTVLALLGIPIEAAGMLYVVFGAANARRGGRQRLIAGGICALALMLIYALSARSLGLMSVDIIAILCWGLAGFVAGFMATAGEVRFTDRRDLGIFTLQFLGVALVVSVGGFYLFRDDWVPFALGVVELLGVLYGVALIDSAVLRAAVTRHKGVGIALIAIGLVAQGAWTYITLHHVA